MRRSDQLNPTRRRRGFGISKEAAIAAPVYREFVGMLFSMRLPVVGLGAVYVSIAGLAAYALEDPLFAGLALLGALVTLARLLLFGAYARVSPVVDIGELRRWEHRYAIGNYAQAILLAALNGYAIAYHHPLLHLLTVSLVFTFGAGVVSRISVRPVICVASLLLATTPTVAALAVHALFEHPLPLHRELYAIQALIVAMVTGLSLQTVVHLYRSAVEHHTARHDLARLAKHDALTGLANRLLLRERFQAGVGTMYGGKRLAVHFLDLDGFKAINDRYGHPAGDAILDQVARRLEAMLRSGDTVARLGGDEFVVLQTDVVHADEAEILARRIVRNLSAPYEVDGTPMRVSASVGVAMVPEFGVELERLLACADAALYRAKRGGKSRALFCIEDDAGTVDLAA